MTIRRRWLLGGSLAGISSSLSARAEVTSWLGKMTEDRLELEVRVLDESGRPLIGAVLWFSDGRNRGLQFGNPDLEAMERMAARYASQGDFLSDEIPGTVFRRTDTSGILRDYRVANRGVDTHYPYIIVATKRGHLLKAVQGVAELNRHHQVEIRLRRDPTVPVIDPRMETFDLLMAQARSVQPGEDVMGEARMLRLQSLDGQLRALAEELEREGRRDDASALYWALADFPSVTREVTPQGQVILGYANGSVGPAAERLRLQAIGLATRTPQLLVEKAFMAEGFVPRAGIPDAEAGQAYLRSFESVASGPYRDGILPSSWRVAIFQAIRWSTPEQSCELLNRAYRFEPFTMSLKAWWERLRDVERQRAKLNLPPQRCVIEGLPALPAGPISGARPPFR